MSPIRTLLHTKRISFHLLRVNCCYWRRRRYVMERGKRGFSTKKFITIKIYEMMILCWQKNNTRNYLFYRKEKYPNSMTRDCMEKFFFFSWKGHTSKIRDRFLFFLLVNRKLYTFLSCQNRRSSLTSQTKGWKKKFLIYLPKILQLFWNSHYFSSDVDDNDASQHSNSIWWKGFFFRRFF